MRPVRSSRAPMPTRSARLGPQSTTRRGLLQPASAFSSSKEGTTMDPTASGMIDAGPAQIGALGVNGAPSTPIFGGTAGRALLQNGFNINVLRPCLDGPADTANPRALVDGRAGDG